MAAPQDAPKSLLLTLGEKTAIPKILDALDEIRHLLTREDDISVPTIAVIGTQSSGKSTVLQRMSGISLPTGIGLKTKCPLQLSMRRSEKSSCEIGILSNEMTPCEMEDIPERIEQLSETIMEDEDEDIRETFRLSARPIFLTVTGPHLQPLTLVDLPGLYSVSDDGTLIPGLEDHIKSMYKKYIDQPNCIILCVLPATEDVQTQKARGWTKEADPLQVRSVFALTKTDTARSLDEEKLAAMSKVLTDNRLKSAGATAEHEAVWFALANKIDRAEVAPAEEAKFLYTLFPRASSRRLGLQSLVRFLCEKQEQVITAEMEPLMEKLNRKLEEYRTELRHLPAEVTPDNAELIYQDKAGEFLARLRNIRDGRDTVLEKGCNFMGILDARAKKFEETIERESSRVFSTEFREKMDLMFHEQRGAHMADIHRPYLLVKLVKEEVMTKMQFPAVTFMQQCHAGMTKVLQNLVQESWSSYPRIEKLVWRDVQNALAQVKEAVNSRVEELLSLESCDVYTCNHYYEENMNKWRAKSRHMLHFMNNRTTKPDRFRAPGAGLDDEVSDDEASDDDEVSDDDDEVALKQWEYHAAELERKKAEIGSKFAEPVTPEVSNDDESAFNVQLMFVSYRRVLHKRFVDAVCLMARYWYTEKTMAEVKQRLLRRQRDIRGELVELMNASDNAERRRDLHGRITDINKAAGMLSSII